MPAGADPRVDYAFKWLFGREGSSLILISLLNAVLTPSPGEQIAEIQLLNPFTEKMALDDKLSVLDVKARDQQGRQFNIEMQMSSFRALPQRILFYWSKLYTEQIQAGDDYGLLRPTISVCFVDDILLAGADDCHSCFRLTERRSGITFTNDITIHVLELPKFTKSAQEIETELDRWLYLLKHAIDLDPQKLPETLEKPELRQALEALIMLTQTDMQKEIYEGREKARRDERARAQDAIEKVQRALEQGLEQGLLMGRIETLQSLLGQAPTPRSDLQAMSIEELQRMADALRQQLGR